MKVAFVHDHLIQNGGAERVLATLQAMWPDAPTFSLAYSKQHMDAEFGHRTIHTSFLQRFPGALNHLRWLLPLMPTATESYDLSNFDVVISSCSAFAKGIITTDHTVHICYCHTPTRYLWSDTISYLSELKVPGFIKFFLPFLFTWLRAWDKLAADRVDFFVANSEAVKQRITKYYRRDSTVIFPPVTVDKFQISSAPKKYFLIGGRLVAYKRFDLVVQAFTKLGLPLKIFGSGPAEPSLRKIAGPNIEFLGRVSDAERIKLFEAAIAFLHPHEEDFGITAVESMAAGRPVIALRRGGAIETVIDGVTGTLFDEQSWEELASVVLRFDEKKFDPQVIRAHAQKFSDTIFRQSFSSFVNQKWLEHKQEKLGLL
jgi:glycosyltransferase involved in cell wall biosynthesis